MKIKYFRSLWGAHLPSMRENISATKEAGFDGIEFIAMPDQAECEEFGALMEEYGLEFILQVGSGAGTGPAVGPEGVEEHIRSLRKEIQIGAGLKPLFVNAHAGRDWFGIDENIRIIEAGHEEVAKHGLELLVETHRGRMTYSVPNTLDLVRRCEGLQLTADLSHWTCVHESLLSDQHLSLVALIERMGHIHARVGDDQKPQVDDPFAEENKAALDAHLRLWKQIVESRVSRECEVTTVTVEHGPKPYWPNEEDKSKLWQINCKMKDLLQVELG